MVKKLLCLTAAALIVFSGAAAMAADIGTATTDVYVRDNENGNVVGSLVKGDRVIVTGDAKNGYKRVEIGGKEYKVYGDYLEIEGDLDADGVEVTTKVSKSKSMTPDKDGIVGKKEKHKIKGSKFEGVYFW